MPDNRITKVVGIKIDLAEVYLEVAEMIVDGKIDELLVTCMAQYPLFKH
jgi:hypothetical protein